MSPNNKDDTVKSMLRQHICGQPHTLYHRGPILTEYGAGFMVELSWRMPELDLVMISEIVCAPALQNP